MTRPLTPARCRWFFSVAALAAGVLAVAAQTGVLATLAGGPAQVSGAPVALAANGQVQVSDGAQIALSGTTARLGLTRGGVIHLCGPARVGLAAGGGGALLISLAQGAMELRYAAPLADTWLTPDFRILTVVPPRQLTAVSASLGLQAGGAICLMNRGSALSVQNLWSGTQQYVINGESLEFHPDGTTVGVASCPCAAPPPPPVSNDQSGPAVLFPTQPALTVAAGSAAAAPASTPLKPTPPPRPHHNFLVRFLRWLVGKH